MLNKLFYFVKGMEYRILSIFVLWMSSFSSYALKNFGQNSVKNVVFGSHRFQQCFAVSWPRVTYYHKCERQRSLVLFIDNRIEEVCRGGPPEKAAPWPKSKTMWAWCNTLKKRSLEVLHAIYKEHLNNKACFCSLGGYPHFLCYIILVFPSTCSCWVGWKRGPVSHALGLGLEHGPNCLTLYCSLKCLRQKARVPQTPIMA